MANLTVSSNVDSLMSSADYAAMRGLLGLRESLTANRTYYVRADGNDSNTGSADTEGGAFLTIQKAIDVIAAIDGAGFAGFIQAANGTYTGAVVLKNLVGFTSVTIQGNASDRALVILSRTGSVAADSTVLASGVTSGWVLKDLTLSIATAGYGLTVNNLTSVAIDNVRFTASSATNGMQIERGSIVDGVGRTIEISGAFSNFAAIVTDSTLDLKGSTIVLSNSCSFAGQHVFLSLNSIYNIISATVTGTATGVRYTANLLSTIRVNGGLDSNVPGGTVGVLNTGSQRGA